MKCRYRVEQELRGLVNGHGFHVAGPLAVAAVHHHTAVHMADPICQLRAMFLLQPAERPIGVRDHVDAAGCAQQNCVFWGGVTSGGAVLRRFENLFGVFDELAHASFIVLTWRNSNELVIFSVFLL